MLKLIIEDDEGRKTVVPFVRDEITIGRQEGNTIRLTERNVSRRHARLLRMNGHVVVEDLGSYNGIRVNGEKLVGRAEIADGDLIQIGDYDLAIQKEAQAEPPPPPLQNGARKHTPPAPVHAAPPPAPAPLEEPETEAASPVYESDKLEDTAPSASASEHDLREAADAARRHATSIIRVDQVEANRQRPVADLEPEEAPRLVVVNTEFAGREFACIRTELRIGRADDNDISLDHRSLSRTHAKLVREASGEWRVVDLQSANGMKVNGESYAQATVTHLDTIELGHLRLRFVGAGQKYAFNAAAEERAERRGTASMPKKASSSKVPLFIGLGLFLLAGGGAGAYFVLFANKADSAQTPPEPVAITPKDAQGQPAANGANAAATEAKARALLATYSEVLTAGDLARARAALTEIEGLGTLSPELTAQVQGAADQLSAEQDVPRRLDKAEKELAAGKLDGARELLQDAASTIAFAERHAALSAQLETQTAAAQAQQQAAQQAAAQKQQQAAQAAAAAASAAGSQKQTNDRAPALSPGEEAQRLADQAYELLKEKRDKEARTALARCVKLDPRLPKCHLLLGATKFRSGEQDEAMPHFEAFLKLAPADDKDAAKIKTLVAKHKQSKQAP